MFMINKNDSKAEDLEQAHLDFISTVSHELRTPLTSIRGFADTLLNSYDKLSEEQKVKFLHIIKDQSNRLINLVENLLAVSKINSEKELFVYKSVDIKPYVESCIQIVKNQYKNRIFQTESPQKAPCIRIDTDKFQQVIINLLDNAAKYSPENTIVKVKIVENLSDNLLQINVINSGEEISEENIEKIFKKFSRIDSPLTRKIQGSGLGLYITKNIVEKMEGKICVISKDNETVFSVIFPIADFCDSTSKKIKE